MKTLKAAFTLILMIANHLVLSACSCVPSSDNLNYIRYDVVQTSGIISIEYLDKYWKVTLSENINTHKGNPVKEFYIDKELQNSSCRIEIQETRVWLLFLYKDSNSEKHFLGSCSGSRPLGAGELYLSFDSTSIYDTTIFKFSSEDYLKIIKSFSDTTSFKEYLDSCSSDLNVSDRLVVVLIHKRNGEIECAKEQIKKIDPALLRQINDCYKGRIVQPQRLNGTAVNVEIIVPFKKTPPH